LNEWWKLSGWCGLIWLVLFIIGAFVLQGDGPMYDDSIDEIRAFFVDDSDNYLAGGYLIGLASIIFFVPFVLGLSHYVALAERGPQFYARIAMIAGVLIVVLAASASVYWTALAFGAAKEVDDSVLQTLMYLDYAGFNFLPFAFALLIGSVSVVVVLESILYVWAGLLGFVVVIIDLLAPLGILSTRTDDIFGVLTFIAYVTFILWVLTMAICLITRTEEPNTV
jgi:hypothetical protein